MTDNQIEISADDVMRLTKELVSIPSVSGAEKGVAELLARRMSQLGFDAQLQEVTNDRWNCIGILPGDGSGPTLVFNGHLDMGPPLDGWSRNPYEPWEENGWLYGAGITNMKGGVAAMTVAAAVAGREKRRGDIVVAAVMGECDKLGTGTKHFIDVSGVRSDAAICGEPTSLALQIAHGGTYQFEIRVPGRAAHNSRQEEGVDAIARLAQILGNLRASKLTFQPHRLLDALPRLVVGQISGGNRVSQTAAHSQAQGDIRLVPGMTPTTLKGDLERLIAEVDGTHPPELRATVHLLTYQRPFIMDPQSPIVLAVAEAHKSVTGAPVSITSALPVQAYATDSSHLLHAGIPTALYGPSQWEVTADERLRTEELITAARVYALAARSFVTRR